MPSCLFLLAISIGPVYVTLNKKRDAGDLRRAFL